jgi:hypothetical protein
MRLARGFFCVLVVSMLFVGGYALAANAPVALTAQGPQPATVTVDWGDTVTFSNQDSVERGVNLVRAGITNVTIQPGASYEHRFDGRAGRYSYTQTGPRPLFSGVVMLTAAGKVTLKASKVLAPYGTTISLSGQSSYPGTPVVVQFRQTGASGDWATLLSPNAGADGSYSGKTRLTAGGRMRAVVAAGQVSSDTVDVAVVPKVRVSVNRRRVPKGARIVVTGRVAPASAVKTVDLEERLAGRSAWLRKATKSVSKSGVVKFVVKASEGRSRLRLSLKRAALEPGFAPTLSRSLLVVGT